MCLFVSVIYNWRLWLLSMFSIRRWHFLILSSFFLFFSFLYFYSLNFNIFSLFLLQGIVRILKSLFSLENKIDQVPLSSEGPGKTPSNVLPGSWLCSILEEVGLLHTMVRTFLFLFFLFLFFLFLFSFFSFYFLFFLLFFFYFFSRLISISFIRKKTSF